MRFKKVIKMFESGSVCVTGMRGSGKDMLTSNVVIRRKLPYISNINYGGDHSPLVMSDLDCGKNTYRDFMSGNVHFYEFPYPDFTDIYWTDIGVYAPSQFCNELNKEYAYFPSFLALSRQLGECNVHFNVQNLNRAWDKIREQSDQYILCRQCFVLFRGKFVIQKIRIYELYDSCVKRVPPFRLSKPLLSRERTDRWRMEKERYEQTYGVVKQGWLIYRNKSSYDTRFFRSLLLGGKKT